MVDLGQVILVVCQRCTAGSPDGGTSGGGGGGTSLCTSTQHCTPVTRGTHSSTGLVTGYNNVSGMHHVSPSPSPITPQSSPLPPLLPLHCFPCLPLHCSLTSLSTAPLPPSPLLPCLPLHCFPCLPLHCFLCLPLHCFPCHSLYCFPLLPLNCVTTHFIVCAVVETGDVRV